MGRARARCPHGGHPATRGPAALQLQAVQEDRELLYFLVWRDVKGRYRQMALNPLWISSPRDPDGGPEFALWRHLPTTIDGLPYPIFTFVALLPDVLCQRPARSGGQPREPTAIDRQGLHFPRLIIPLSQVLSTLLDFLASFMILMRLMLFYRLCRPGGY